MIDPGPTGYCSERCLLWSTLGVPALKEDELVVEILLNQRLQHAPEGWTPPAAYPTLADYAVWEEAKPIIIQAAASLGKAPTHA